MIQKIQIEELMNIPQIELTYVRGARKSPLEKISDSENAYKAFKQSWNPGTIELVMEVKIMYLNNAGELLGIYAVSNGGMTQAGVDPRLIFAGALLHAATGIIVCMNQPSGKLNVSRATEDFARQLRQGGKILNIEVSDYLIITADGYKSFADDGLL